MYRFLRLLGSQNWLRFGIRNRLISWFCNPDTVGSTEFVSDYFCFKYAGNLNSYIDWNVFFYGAYEREYLLFLKQLIDGRENPVFIDIGANVGCHTLYMSQFCGEVHAFEPNPKVRAKLMEKINRNTINNVIIHDVGLGTENEDLPYFEPIGCNEGTGSFVEGYSKNNENIGVLLKVVQGDQYFSKLGLSKIDLIKIDVEGFEKYVLIGLKETLQKYRPIIFLEFSEATRESISCQDEFIGLFPDGYKVMRTSCNNPRGILFNSPDVSLVSFDFQKSIGNLLIYPA